MAGTGVRQRRLWPILAVLLVLTAFGCSGKKPSTVVVKSAGSTAGVGSGPDDTTLEPGLPVEPTTVQTTSTTTASTTTTAPVAAAHGPQRVCIADGVPAPTGLLLGVLTASGVAEVTEDGATKFMVPGSDANSMQPDWSKDTLKVVFSERDPTLRTSSGNPPANLVVSDVTAACSTPLSTQTSDVYESPSWSTDAQKLAYIHHLGGTYMVSDLSKIKLEVSNATGGGAVSVGGSRAYGPAWAPDGSGRIVYSDSDGLKLRQPDGQTKILNSTYDTEFATWSPDSKRIAFSISTDAAVWVVNVDGTGFQALTPRYRDEPHAMAFLPSWSPDGSQIAFNRACCSSPSSGPLVPDIWVVNADGTNAHGVTTSHAAVGFPHWSPSGDEIAYDEGPYPGPWNVMVINADGTNPRVVMHDAQLFAFFHRPA
jgi:Tol biopolymer transport system component